MMNIIWGIVIVVLVSIAWIGQIISALSPELGAKLGVCEPEAEVDKTFFIDQRGEAIWDSITCWILLAAGILMLLNIQVWVYFGIIGGSIFFNFSGRGIITRIALQRNGIAIGNPKGLAANYLFLTLWLIMSMVTVFLSIKELPLIK